MQNSAVSSFAVGGHDLRGDMEQWFAPRGDGDLRTTARLQEKVLARHPEQGGRGGDPGDGRRDG